MDNNQKFIMMNILYHKVLYGYISNHEFQIGIIKVL